jgi:hypothetical protein
MTLEEVEDTLPNGLHDAEVQRIVVDYAQHKLTLDLAVWVGEMDDPPEKREAYKIGQLEISGLIYLVMEAPDPKYPYRTSSKLTIDSIEDKENMDSELVKALPANSFCRRFWVSEWNAFMRIAATSAQMVWMDEGTITYR